MKSLALEVEMLTDGEPPEPEAQAGSPEWLSNGDAVLAPDIPKATIVEP
jgi:hypothetical protein